MANVLPVAAVHPSSSSGPFHHVTDPQQKPSVTRTTWRSAPVSTQVVGCLATKVRQNFQGIYWTWPGRKNLLCISARAQKDKSDEPLGHFRPPLLLNAHPNTALGRRRDDQSQAADGKYG